MWKTSAQVCFTKVLNLDWQVKVDQETLMACLAFMVEVASVACMSFVAEIAQETPSFTQTAKMQKSKAKGQGMGQRNQGLLQGALWMQMEAGSEEPQRRRSRKSDQSDPKAWSQEEEAKILSAKVVQEDILLLLQEKEKCPRVFALGSLH